MKISEILEEILEEFPVKSFGVFLPEWLEAWAPYLSHFHIHNNDGSWDNHDPLDRGSIPMKEFLEKASALCPEATFTLELLEAEPSVRWMTETGLI